MDQAIRNAGLDCGALYLTNAVKHFHFRARGRRRLHQTPSPAHIEAYRWWLDLERARLRPAVILALAQTAWTALSPGMPFCEGAQHVPDDGALILATLHPANALRSGMRGDGIRKAITAALVQAGEKAGLLSPAPPV